MDTEAVGNTLEKIFPGTAHKPFAENFIIKRPEQADCNFETIRLLHSQLVVIECLNHYKTTLRGQIEYLPETNQLLFLGSPWFGSMEQVIENKLTLHDFAYHDPMIDLLHVLKTQEITTEDLKHLLKTINRQKNELKEANREIHEIALFPTQNPDPMLRINPAGEILRNNPAAAALQSFEFENNRYSSTELFSLIAPRIDMDKERFIFEASSGNKDFSFVCIPMKKEGYINIYSRDVTQQNITQQELEKLSLIIQQTQNAVIVTDAFGKVEWVNNAFEKVTGFNLAEVAGKKPGHVLQGKDTDPHAVEYMRAQIQKAEPFVCEIYNYKKSGEGYWLRINGQPIFDKTGKVSRFFAIEEDITSEREAEEKLKEFDKRIHLALQNIGDNVWEHNFITEETSFSQEEFKLLGYTSSDFESNKDLWYNCIYEADKKIVIENDSKYRNGQISHHLLEYRMIHKDGTIKWVLDRGVVIEKNKEGKPVKIIGTHTDITGQKGIEQKLEDQRKFYEEILDNIPADIAVFDKEHRYLYLNPKAISDPELRKWMVGKKDEDYIRERNKPLSILDGRRQLFNEIIQAKQLKSWEEELKQPGGNSNFVLRNMYPVLNDEHEVELVIGYGVDITDIKNIQQQIKQSEKRYRDVIDNSLAIITTHDMDGKFITINPMVAKIYGYTDEEMIGHSLMEFIPQEDKIHFNENYLNRIKQDKEASGIFRVLNKKGETVYSLYNNYLKEEPGQEPYVIGFAVDITDRVKAEKELKVAKKITEELAQTKQNFLANMSHEIRTPMNAIMGMSNQLAKTPLSESQQFYLNVIHSAADNLLVIINDILDLSKIDAGKLSLEKIGFEPRLVVGRVMQVMMHRAEEKGLALTNSFCDSRLSQVLIGDPYRLNQVLLNLVSNAIKFTEKGIVDITCSVKDENETTQTVQVAVSDTGIGMDESFVNNLFNKFTQEDESVTRRFGGTGLGMSICKELVELMGGTINVNSRKGIGTGVSFTITFNKGTAEQLPVKETQEIDTKIFAGKKILVTDDNEMNRLVAATLLEAYGANINEARNGEEAVEKIKTNKYDLVLMDVQMPVMDGFEATRIIRNTISKDLPVIALTAFAIKGDNLKCFEAGMNDYLSKPFEESQLLHIVSKWLGKYQAIKENKIHTTPVKPATLYDLSKLKEISKGNEAFVQKMVTLFCDQTPASVAEMKEAYMNGDYKKLKAVAHRIKPSIDNMGILSLKNEIRDIETNAETYQRSEQLEKLLNQVDQVITEVIQKLKDPIS